MSFFYDLNKRLADLAKKTEQQQIAESKKAEAVAQSPLTQALNESDYSAKKARAGKDIGKPGKNFAKIAKSAAERYGSKEAGERVAGAVLNKLRHPKESAEHGDDVMDYLNDKLKDFDAQHPAKEGNAFTGKLKATPKGGKFELDGKTYKDTSGLDEADVTGLGEEGTASSTGGTIHKTARGLRHVAGKHYAGVDDDDSDDFDDETPKTKGRPKGSKRAIGAKVSGTSKLHRQAAIAEDELDEGYAEMDAWLKKREAEKGTGKFDVKDTGYSKRYTRKHEEEPESDDEVSDAPKKKGRPAGTKRAIGAKVKGTSKLHQKAAIAECDPGEYDEEGEMAKGQIHTIVRHAKELESVLHDDQNLPEWVQEKLGQIKGMMTTVADYMISNRDRGIEQSTGEEGFNSIEEKAPPGAKAERMVKHIKKSLSKDGHLSDKDKAIAYATTWKAHNAGKVEEEGKPDFLDLDKDGNKEEPMKQAAKQAKAKKKEEKVDETTTSGSVATAPAAPKSSKGGMQFGKGVYESLDSKLENMISEGMNITVTMSNNEQTGEPFNSINVQADGADADKLAELLKMAGLESHRGACQVCGESPCGCAEMVDENSPDWPTDEETIDADPQLRTYSGGLNGPKSTGQTTSVGGGIPNRDNRRQASMEESVELERSLFQLYKNYKG